jgi:hypothetical protein
MIGNKTQSKKTLYFSFTTYSPYICFDVPFPCFRGMLVTPKAYFKGGLFSFFHRLSTTYQTPTCGRHPCNLFVFIHDPLTCLCLSTVFIAPHIEICVELPCSIYVAFMVSSFNRFCANTVKSPSLATLHD